MEQWGLEFSTHGAFVLVILHYFNNSVGKGLDCVGAESTSYLAVIRSLFREAWDQAMR